MEFLSEYVKSLRKKILQKTGKKYFLSKINKALEESIEPIAEEDIECDLIRGVLVVQNVIMKDAPVAQLGLSLAEGKIESMVIQVPWYSQAQPTEVALDGVTIKVSGNACVCSKSLVCYKCAKACAPETGPVPKQTMLGLVKARFVQHLVASLSSRVTVKAQRVEIVAELERRHSVCIAHGSAEQTAVGLVVEAKGVDAQVFGVSFQNAMVHSTVADRVLRTTADLGKCVIDLKDISTREVAKAAALLQGTEEKREKAPKKEKEIDPTKEEKDAKTKTSSFLCEGFVFLKDCSVEVRGKPGMARMQVQVHNGHVHLTEKKSTLCGDVFLLEGDTEVCAVTHTEMEIVHMEDKPMAVLSKAKKLKGKASSAQFQALVELFQEINAVCSRVLQETDGSKGTGASTAPESTPSSNVFVTVEETSLSLALERSKAKVQACQTQIHLSEHVTCTSELFCFVEALKDTGAQSVSFTGSVSLRHKDSLVVDTASIATESTSVQMFAVLEAFATEMSTQYGQARGGEYLHAHSSSVQSSPSVHSQPGSASKIACTHLTVAVTACGHPVVVVLEEAEVSSLSVFIKTVTVSSRSSVILALSPCEVFSNGKDTTTIVCSNGEALVSNDPILLELAEEISLYCKAQSKERNPDTSIQETSKEKSGSGSGSECKDRDESKSESEDGSEQIQTVQAQSGQARPAEEQTLESADTVEALETVETGHTVHVSLTNTKARLTHPKCECTVEIKILSVECGETVSITKLEGGIESAGEKLGVVCKEFLFDTKKRTMAGEFQGEGELSADLYTFVLNRAFFILDIYMILTQYSEEEKPPLIITIKADVSIGLTKNGVLLAKVVGKSVTELTKTEKYFGTVSVAQVKAWSAGELIATVPKIEVKFAKTSPLCLSLSLSLPSGHISDALGVFLDLQGHFLAPNYRYDQAFVGTQTEVRCTVGTVTMASGEALVTLTNFCMINQYMQMEVSLEIGGQAVTSTPVKVTVRQTAYERNEMHVAVGYAAAVFDSQAVLQSMHAVLNRLNQRRVQQFPAPVSTVVKLECAKADVCIARPPVKIEVQQAWGTLFSDFELTCLVRVYGQNRETLEYEVLCEQFPLEVGYQTNVPVEKDKMAFYSLPFSDTDSEPLLVSFLSVTVKDTVRVRLSTKMMDALKTAHRDISLTNHTNRALCAGETELPPGATTTISDTTPVKDASEKVLFTAYPPNTMSAVQSSRNVYISAVKQNTVCIQGCTTFKNMTDSAITVHCTEEQERVFLLPFSECSHTERLLSFSVEVDTSEASRPVLLAFTLPSAEDSVPDMFLVERKRVETQGSYMTIMCLVEKVSGCTVLHYVFFHEFIISNLSGSPISFEMKITSKSKVERISGIAGPGEIKQISGAIEPGPKRKPRLRINKNVDLYLLSSESKEKTSVSKGLYVVTESKNVLIHGHLLSVGIVHATVHPGLVAVNNTEDPLEIKCGSTATSLPPGVCVELATSKDKHHLVLGKKESASFSSKIHSNSVFLDIKNKHYRNYLVSIVKGDGSKEKIKYIVVEYANTVKNQTGLDMTIVTDREFSCGHGEPVPVHFPKKKVNTWIRLGLPADGLEEGAETGTPSGHSMDLEDVEEASYLPLEGLKRHLVKLHSPQGPILLAVTIHVVNNQRVIFIEKETEWPYTVKNALDVPFTFSQKGYHITYTVQPEEEMPYYWDSFKAQPAFDIRVGDKSLLVKTFVPVTEGPYKAVLVSEGMKKTLVVSRKTHEQAAETHPQAQGLFVQAKTERVSISLLDREEKEFGCIHLFSGLAAVMSSSNGWEFFVRLDSFQLDNQELRSHYPIPVHTPGMSEAFSVSGWFVSPTVIRYLSIVVLPVVIQFDEEYMKRVITHFMSLAEPQESPKYFIRCTKCEHLKCTCTYTLEVPQRSQYITLDYLKIEPIKLRISFRRAPQNSIVPLSSLVCNITSSKISLPDLQLSGVYARYSEVMQIVEKAYKRGFLKNIVSLALSVDIVGSPGELLDTLGVGVHDLIYAPYRALDNPALLSKTLFSGGKSLAKNVVTGVAEFVGKITGKLSQKLASISMDEKFAEMSQETSCVYIEEIDMVLPQSKANLTKAGEKFIRSCISGVRGVLHSPLQGSRSNGLSGMVQGLGKGLVGVVFKPISGVMGLAQDVTMSISEALQEVKPLLRVQLPRAPPLSGTPQEYESERNVYYRAYNCITGNDPKKDERFITGGMCVEKYTGWFVLITSTRVIFYNKSDIFEVQGLSSIQGREKTTTVTVGNTQIEVEGTRVSNEAMLLLK
ncbi:hypothetical protein NECID01_1282 [Nematocida sp. AWRm77]|nr:hypothetical protein NECID01_1282 [Nematocida sp. AWRm77]